MVMVRETIQKLISQGKLSTWLDEDEHVEAFQTILAALENGPAGLGGSSHG